MSGLILTKLCITKLSSPYRANLSLNNDKFGINKKIDNELKKKEMEAKYGASFHQVNDIPPDLENEWLQSIERFENEFQSAKLIKIWERLGKPDYKKLSDIKPEDITGELKSVIEKLNENQISLDTLCEVDDKELYRFITEELFDYEMDDMHVPGMMSCFIYEEFHPNAKHDIEMAFDYFFRMTMAKMENIGGEGYDLLYVDKDGFVGRDNEAIEKERVISQINNFLDAFDTFEITNINIDSIQINDTNDDAQIQFYIEYNGLFESSTDVVTYKGNAIFKLRPGEYGGWSIYYIDMPGFL